MKKRVADILVETLLELGIDRNFCVVGGGAMHLNNAFAVHNEMKTVFCHHEQACAFAAEGYAKLTGKIAAVSVTSGPGAVNTLNGVYSAWTDSTPMLVIAGHPRYDTTVEACGLDLRCRGVQEVDIIPMVKGITKYSVMLKNPLEVKRCVHEAYYQAMSGRRGPVWISVPLDVQAMLIEEDECLEVINYQKDNQVDAKLVDEAIELLRKAKRPVVLTGAGIRYSDSMTAFRQLTCKLQIPIVGGALLADTLPEEYSLYYGMSGNIGPRPGNYILQNADCILVLGNSLSVRQTGFNVEGFAPNATMIMVDACADEMKKPGLTIELPIHADLEDFIPLMNERLINKIEANADWVQFCENIKAYFANYDDDLVEPGDRIPQKYFWKVFREMIPEDTVLALGNSNAVIGIYHYGVKKTGQRILTNYNAGSMGYDLPEAVGAACGTEAQVICVTGDGSIMMNLQELQTITHNNLRVKIVVFSNNGYGAIRQTCKSYFNGIYAGCDDASGISFPSFENVARTFGFDYMHCKQVSDLEDSIHSFLESKGNIIMEMDQKLNDPILPKIMSRLKEDGTFETPSFKDLSPFLSQQEADEVCKMERQLEHV